MNSMLKKCSATFYLLILLGTLTGCGTPHTVSLSPKPFKISGNYSAGSFAVTRIQLDLNGLTSQTIKKNEALNPKAIIKFKGTGIFQAQWLLDGQVVEQVQVLLNRGSLLSLNPTSNNFTSAQYGRHVIQLKIKQPNVTFKVPDLSFFVAQ